MFGPSNFGRSDVFPPQGVRRKASPSGLRRISCFVFRIFKQILSAPFAVSAVNLVIQKDYVFRYGHDVTVFWAEDLSNLRTVLARKGF